MKGKDLIRWIQENEKMKDRKAYQHAYHMQHKAELNERSRRWKQENREQYLDYQKNYYMQHREQIAARKRERRQQAKC